MKPRVLAHRRQVAINMLFEGCANALPYLERLLDKTKVPSPDYFEIPKIILLLRNALEEGRPFVTPITVQREQLQKLQKHRTADDSPLDERGKKVT